MRILRNFQGGVTDSSLLIIQVVCFGLITIILTVTAARVGEKVHIFSEDIHTITEEIRNTD